MSRPLFKTLMKGLAPDKRYKVSEWAESHRVLSRRSSAEPGAYRVGRTPYAREIMDLLSSDDPTREVVLMKGSQVGGSEIGLNWLGYIIDHSPAPVLLVMPTVEMAKRNSKQRVDPMIEDSPTLRGKVQDPRSRDSSNTMLMKDFKGGTLIMTGANSAVGLRSMPARYIFFDEVDAYPSDADNEGSPIELAKARARTFTNRKFFYVSTPTVANRSEVERIFDSSDRRYFMVPCPFCGFAQKLEFSRLKWEKAQPETARYHCLECNGKIENWQKTEMLDKGKWEKTAESEIAGFHLNALYSPVGWYSWEEIAKDWLKAQRNNDLRRTFVNTVLGETWVDRGEAPDWHRLYERREKYIIGKVPRGVIFLTCGVDIQKDRIEAEVVGWGRNKESWSIQYVVLPGDTSSPDPWKQLFELLSTSFKTWAETDLPIRMMAVDSGYNTQVVYDWCRKFPLSRVVAVKGQAHLETIVGHPKTVEMKMSGKKIKHGLKSWPVGSSLMKSELYGFLRQNAPTNQDEPYPTGYCHFPEYEPAFFEMLTAEELMVKTVKGYKKFEWEKVRDRNEALDCRIYARAAASIVGLDRFTEAHFAMLENQMGLLKPAEIKEAVTAKPQTEIMRRKPSEFWRN